MMNLNGYAVQMNGLSAGALGSGVIFSASNRTVRNRRIMVTAAEKKAMKRSFVKANS